MHHNMIAPCHIVLAVIATLSIIPIACAFSPSPATTRVILRHDIHRGPISSIIPSVSRRTVASAPPVGTVTTSSLQSFFGLGPAELAIVALSGLVLIGPSKLAQFSKEAGSVAGKMGDEWSELKSIPEEFQKGVEEGEIEARSRKAKDMAVVESVTGEKGE